MNIHTVCLAKRDNTYFTAGVSSEVRALSLSLVLKELNNTLKVLSCENYLTDSVDLAFKASDK